MIRIPPSSMRYGSVAMTFHWLIALLVVFDFALAISFSRFNPGERLYLPFAYRLHMSVGMAVLVLSVACILWRLVHRSPPLPQMSLLLRGIARTAHVFLYVFILVVPLTGWLLLSVRRTPAVLVASLYWPNNALLTGLSYAARMKFNNLLMPSHAILAYAAMSLVALHLGAALYHHFGRRDDVLRRMLPAARMHAGFSAHAPIQREELRLK
jgi:cytochrome b561